MARTSQQIALIEALKSLGIEVPQETPKRAPAKRTTKRTSSTPSTKRAATRTKRASTKRTKTSPDVITCEVAWLALGADPQFEPSQPDAPARNGQLWALNAAGMLSLND